MSREFAFDPNLATAATPPAEWYTDPSGLEREKQSIFGRTWQYACSLDLLRLPGNFAAVDVAGTPVVLTRGLGRSYGDVPTRRPYDWRSASMGSSSEALRAG